MISIEDQDLGTIETDLNGGNDAIVPQNENSDRSKSPVDWFPKRKLASVQAISSLVKLATADSLSVATILGWEVVVRTENSPLGCLGIFIEEDSLIDLARHPWALSVFKDGGATTLTVFTIKIRGQYSQGLFLPFTLPQVSAAVPEHMRTVGQDLTDFLDVRQRPDRSDEHRGKTSIISRLFPGLNTTDESRVQSKPQFLSDLKGKPYYIALKYDGSSFTAGMVPGQKEMVLCSRTTRVGENETIPCRTYYWRAAKYHSLPEILALNPTIAIQGEVVGDKINGNRHKLAAPRMYVFNVFENGKQVPFPECKDRCTAMGLDFVQVLEQGESFSHTLESLRSLSIGKYEGTSNPREGIVVRSKIPQTSFKYINPEYLLKYK